MAEATARAKFACPACGAEAHWNPGRQALVCPYCGTTSPAQVELTATGEERIREHDLVAALRSIPDNRRGWQAAKTTVRCQSCRALSVFDAARVGQRCDFCGSAALVPYEDVKAPFQPESLLPLRIDEGRVRELVRGWYRSRWFAPNRLKHAALTDTVRGVYIPYWTFDASVHADWTADAGYYYYETEHYRDAQGRDQTRRVRKVRWVPAAGSVDHAFDDELVAASRGVDARLLKAIEPFPTAELSPYNPGFLSGWVVEQYQIDLVGAAQAARTSMESHMRSLCAGRVPGDTHRNLQVHNHFSNQTFKHILVPVWLLTYRFGARVYQVVVNGSTGALAGTYPKSWVKITLLVLAILAGIGLLTLVAK